MPARATSTGVLYQGSFGPDMRLTIEQVKVWDMAQIDRKPNSGQDYVDYRGSFGPDMR